MNLSKILRDVDGDVSSKRVAFLFLLLDIQVIIVMAYIGRNLPADVLSLIQWAFTALTTAVAAEKFTKRKNSDVPEKPNSNNPT